MNRYGYYRPKTLQEAFRLKDSIPESFYFSGGTDLMVRIKKREIQPRAIISLRSIPNLSGIKNGKIIRIGAMTTLSDIIKNPLLLEKYPVLTQAANILGSVQIRNVATIGGNLCNGSPAAEMAPPLLVYDCKLRLQSAQKSRELPLIKFFKGPHETDLAHNEILTEILLESSECNTKVIYLKKGRTKMDLAVASVAVLIQTEGNRCLKARVAAGSVAPTPLRLFEVETRLEGASFSQELLVKIQEMASESVSPITDVRATEDYRRHLVGVLVRRALEALMKKDPADKSKA
jgi:CO/xanthine dehydrogenase FAD-binding subunit